MANSEGTAAVLTNKVNGVAVDELAQIVNVIKTTPALAKFKFWVRNEWVDGGQNRSTVNGFYGAGQEQSRPRPFVLECDEPAVLLGKDTAANAGEYLLHALAACMTSAIVYHAAARGIEIEEIESSLQGDADVQGFLGLDEKVRNGFEGIRANFKIKANVSDEKLQEIGQLGPKYSPVFDSLTRGVPVSVSTERL